MKPKKFKEVNVIFGENQKEYIPLPAYKADKENGEVVFCFELDQDERNRLLETGELWVSMLTFNRPLIPIFMTTKKSDVLDAPRVKR